MMTIMACAHSDPPPVGDTPQLLGVITLDQGARFAGSRVGGLSDIAYDLQDDRYLAISDDRGQHGPARYYELSLDFADGRLDDGDLRFERLVFLRDRAGQFFSLGAVDPESIALWSPNQLFVATEGDAGMQPPIAPAVGRFTPAGRLNHVLPLPSRFRPDGRQQAGVRDNMAFESVTITPNGRSLWTATENALVQDGPPASLATGSAARLLSYDLPSWRAGPEFVYEVDPAPLPPLLPFGLVHNGLVELLALDDTGRFLALERAYALGAGNVVRVYRVDTAGATDVSNLETLVGATYVPVRKELLFDFRDLGLQPGNVEGMTFGPPLPDGRQTLIFVSDDNFNAWQETQFTAVALKPVGGA